MEECLSSHMCLIRVNLKVLVWNTPNSEPTEKALGFKRHLMGPVVSRQLSCWAWVLVQKHLPFLMLENLVPHPRQRAAASGSTSGQPPGCPKLASVVALTSSRWERCLKCSWWADWYILTRTWENDLINYLNWGNWLLLTSVQRTQGLFAACPQGTKPLHLCARVLLCTTCISN